MLIWEAVLRKTGQDCGAQLDNDLFSSYETLSNFFSIVNGKIMVPSFQEIGSVTPQQLEKIALFQRTRRNRIPKKKLFMISTRNGKYLSVEENSENKITVIYWSNCPLRSKLFKLIVINVNLLLVLINVQFLQDRRQASLLPVWAFLESI